MADFPIIPVYQGNLLVNGGFEIWQRGNGAFTAGSAYTADRWQISLAGTDTLSVSKDTTHNDTQGLSCAACTFVLGTGAGATQLFQKLEDYSQLRGQMLSASVRINQSVANAVEIRLTDSVGATVGTSSSVTGGYVTLTATRAVPSTVTSCFVQLNFKASATVYLDNAMLVIGSQPLDYVPLTPAEEWERCQRYYEVIGGQASAEFFGAGTSFANNGWQTVVTYKEKAVVPTVAFTSAANYQLAQVSGTTAAATITAGNIGRKTADVNGTVAGTPFTAGFGIVLLAASTSGTIAVEANP